MTTGVACPQPILQFFLSNGQLNAGGYVAPTVGGVATAVYQDVGLTTPLPLGAIPNQTATGFQLNSFGQPANSSGLSEQIFLPANTVYIFTVFDSNGNQVNQATYVSGTQINWVSINGDVTGNSDSSTAFQTALNSGATFVFCPPPNAGKSYIVHDVTIPSGVTLFAEGAYFIDAPGANFIFKLTGFDAKLIGGQISSALNCALAAIVIDDGNLCVASGQRIVNATTCIRLQHTSGTCNNAQLSNIQGDNFTTAGIYIGPNVANIQASNINMDANTVVGGGGQIPKAGVTCFQMVGTGTTTNTGGHEFSNCTALNGQTGWSITDTNLIKLSNCNADTLSGVAYDIQGSSFAIDLADVFAGTCAVAVRGGGTSAANSINGIRCFGIGNIPAFGGTTWYSSSGFSAPFFELAQTGTAKFSIDLDEWLSTNAQFAQYAHTLSEAVSGNIAMTGGIVVNFNSAGAIAAATTAWIGPAGNSTTGETTQVILTPPGQFSVANIARIVMNCGTAPGVGQSFTYTLRANFLNTAITGMTSGAATFAATFSGGPVSINPGYQVDMQVVTSAGAASAVHYGQMILIPQP